MIKILIQNYKNLDKKISHILKIGLSFSFIICVVSAMVLLTYMLLFTYPVIYYIGILGIVLGLNFAMSFIISATIIDDVKKESHFKGNQERNKLLLILIIIGIVIFGIPVFSGLFGVVIGIVGGLFGVTLGSFCAGVGCLIGAVACFVKGIMILGELTGASLIILAVGFGLIALSFGFFWIGKTLVKLIPYLFKVGIKFCREMIDRVGEWYEKK